MKILDTNVEPQYTGIYLVRVGQFYWIPDIKNPHNLYEMASVKGVHKFDNFIVKIEDETEEDIFQGLNLWDDQVIISMERL